LREQIEQKTIRFSDLVGKSGRPKAVTLWRQPEEDRAFRLAIRENRVLTVVQPNVGQKRDYGIIGFHRGLPASFLVFPEPLAFTEGMKVIGIRYDLLSSLNGNGKVGKSKRQRKAIS
jgi:hypothetical protein